MRWALGLLAALWLSPAAAQSLSGMAPAPNVLFAFSTSGPLNPGETLPGISWSGPVTLSNTLSTGTCTTAASAETVIAIFNNGLSIGSVTYHAFSQLPTFALSTTPLTGGEFITAVAPPMADATLAGVSFTLAGR